MSYITPIERFGIRKGILQNARESVIEILEARFEMVPETVIECVNRIDDVTVLKGLLKQAIAL